MENEKISLKALFSVLNLSSYRRVRFYTGEPVYHEAYIMDSNIDYILMHFKNWYVTYVSFNLDGFWEISLNEISR